jgi:hypothetical protein
MTRLTVDHARALVAGIRQSTEDQRASSVLLDEWIITQVELYGARPIDIARQLGLTKQDVGRRLARRRQ